MQDAKKLQTQNLSRPNRAFEEWFLPITRVMGVMRA